MHYAITRFREWLFIMPNTERMPSSPGMMKYCKTSNVRRTKVQNLNNSRLVLQLSLPYPLKKVLSRELRCSLLPTKALYIRGLTVYTENYLYSRGDSPRHNISIHEWLVWLCIQWKKNRIETFMHKMWNQMFVVVCFFPSNDDSFRFSSLTIIAIVSKNSDNNSLWFLRWFSIN